MTQSNLLSNNTGNQNVAPKTRLERQSFDVASVRIQMILGFLLVACACVVLYFPALKVGFLLDDFLHVDIAARAFHGDAHDLLANLNSNWAGSDLMKSYRPLISMSFALDYLIWHANALGYHLTNIILLIACCLCVSLITLELTGREGNRVLAAPAIWAALLFAAYPLHPEATVWIVGRVDLFCTCFYLASVFCYLRYQQNLERRFLYLSLIGFGLSMWSKEMAVSLPIVLTAASMLLPVYQFRRQKSDLVYENLLTAIKLVWPFWAVLAAVACLRMYFLGTLVGGYGDSGILSMLVSLKSFFDRSSLNKIIIPASEEIRMHRPMLALCGALIPLTIAFGGIKAVVFRSSLMPFYFLAFWIGIALAPTFQIWHIYPNLVGSRLFFLSSAPLCILLALAAQPAAETIKKRSTAIFATIGMILLSASYLVWTYLLEENLKPWEEAGKRMTALKNQIDEIATKEHGHPVALLSLPRDYKGAGMLTRSSYLTLFCKQPFHATDLSREFAGIELPDANDHSYGERLRALTNNRSCYIWNENEGKLMPWQRQKGLSYFTFNFSADKSHQLSVSPPEVVPAAPSAWKIREPQASYIEQYPDFIRVFPGIDSQALTILPKLPTNVDPLAAQFAIVHCIIHERDDQTPNDGPRRASKVSFYWNGTDIQQNKPAEFVRSLEYIDESLFIAPVGENPDWNLSKNVSQIGLKFVPGNYVVDVYSIDIGSCPKSMIVPESSPDPLTDTKTSKHEVN
jgi:hypothetical protein